MSGDARVSMALWSDATADVLYAPWTYSREDDATCTLSNLRGLHRFPGF